jgi:formate dehydrogenase maturation protein FdhE
VFEESGKRSLVCGFCRHKWTLKRVYCTFKDFEILLDYNTGHFL